MQPAVKERDSVRGEIEDIVTAARRPDHQCVRGVLVRMHRFERIHEKKKFHDCATTPYSICQTAILVLVGDECPIPNIRFSMATREKFAEMLLIGGIRSRLMLYLDA